MGLTLMFPSLRVSNIFYKGLIVNPLDFVVIHSLLPPLIFVTNGKTSHWFSVCKTRNLANPCLSNQLIVAWLVVTGIRLSEGPGRGKVFSLAFRVIWMSIHQAVDFAAVIVLLRVFGSLQATHISLWSPKFQVQWLVNVEDDSPRHKRQLQSLKDQRR